MTTKKQEQQAEVSEGAQAGTQGFLPTTLRQNPKPSEGGGIIGDSSCTFLGSKPPTFPNSCSRAHARAPVHHPPSPRLSVSFS
jgi:hypothetical protein